MPVEIGPGVRVRITRKGVYRKGDKIYNKPLPVGMITTVVRFSHRRKTRKGTMRCFWVLEGVDAPVSEALFEPVGGDFTPADRSFKDIIKQAKRGETPLVTNTREKQGV